MKKAAYLAISAILSLLIHGLLFAFGDHIRLGEIAFFQPEPELKRDQIVTNYKVVRPENHPQTQAARDAAEEKGFARADRIAERMNKLFREQGLAKTVKPKVELDGLGKNILVPRLSGPEKARPATAPRPEIVEIDMTSLPAERQAFRRPLRRKLNRTTVPAKQLPSLLSPGSLQGAVGGTYTVAMREGRLPGIRGLSIGDLPPDEKGDGTGKGNGGRGRGGLAPAGGIPGLKDFPLPGVEVAEKKGDADSRADRKRNNLDDYVRVDVTVFQERDGSGYFHAAINATPRSEELWDVPKDILFILDHSTSISAPKLKQFKLSTIESLQILNQKDRFNVVSFTSVAKSLFPDYVPWSEESFARGEEYISGLRRGGMTDVFNGISPYVKKSNGRPSRPLNVFLMTDGNSTVNIYDESDFIQTVKQMNPGNVSIYTFSAGRKANRRLLEFLGAHNRGYNMHVEELKEFRSKLVDYISKHSQIILADVNYHSAGGLDAESFPKALPHLYRRETLSFYGHFPKETKDLNIQISGIGGDGEEYDLVFRRAVSECLKGTRELAQDWANQKVYHLIGQRILTKDEKQKAEISKQIQDYSQEFKLYVPY